MEAFYVCIIFLGIILVIAALFFIIMDKVNGKDFFKEFDRKKDEMFNLIQDSEEMVQELNKMSDYVVTAISEKNQEFFNKNAILNSKDSSLGIEEKPKELLGQVEDEQILLGVSENRSQNELSEGTVLRNINTSKGLVIQNKDIKLANQEAVNQSKDVKLANQELVSQSKDVKLENQEAINQNKEIDFEKQENIFNSVENEIVDNGSNDNSTDIQKSSDLTLTHNNVSEDITSETAESISKPKLSLGGIRGQVLQMIEKGLTDEEISKRLRVGKGEISLIRGLSK